MRLFCQVGTELSCRLKVVLDFSARPKRSGAYQRQEKATGQKQFYRFQKPANDGYPFMLELFRGHLDAMSVSDDSHLTPMPVDAAVSSLSLSSKTAGVWRDRCRASAAEPRPGLGHH